MLTDDTASLLVFGYTDGFDREKIDFTARVEGRDVVVTVFSKDVVGPKMIVWRTVVHDLPAHDSRLAAEHLARPIEWLKDLFADAEKRGYARGLQEGAEKAKAQLQESVALVVEPIARAWRGQ